MPDTETRTCQYTEEPVRKIDTELEKVLIMIKTVPTEHRKKLYGMIEGYKIGVERQRTA